MRKVIYDIFNQGIKVDTVMTLKESEEYRKEGYLIEERMETVTSKAPEKLNKKREIRKLNK